MTAIDESARSTKLLGNRNDLHPVPGFALVGELLMRILFELLVVVAISIAVPMAVCEIIFPMGGFGATICGHKGWIQIFLYFLVGTAIRASSRDFGFATHAVRAPDCRGNRDRSGASPVASVAVAHVDRRALRSSIALRIENEGEMPGRTLHIVSTP